MRIYPLLPSHLLPGADVFCIAECLQEEVGQVRGRYGSTQYSYSYGCITHRPYTNFDLHVRVRVICSGPRYCQP